MQNHFAMKTLFCLLFVFFFALNAFTQTSNQSKPAAAQLTEKSVVKDTAGTVYPYAIWRQLLVTGHYNVRPENPADANSAFIITRLSEEEYEQKMASLPKPRESTAFKTGATFSYFKTTDINGNKVNSKSLEGKILVLNFWFINCPPCRMEMPELNKLVEEYRNDSAVLFIAIGLDDKNSIKSFLKTNPFNYTIIDDGRFLANEYKIGSYPTNVIITPDGKVYFHSVGLSSNTVYWLKKSIAELQQAMQKKEVAGN